MIQFRNRIASAFLASSLLTMSATASADSFDKGERAFVRGDYPEAVRLFSKSEKPEAAFRMGVLAEKGVVANCDLQCAARWYARSADAGHIPAIPAIAILYYNSGQRELAFELFRYGARWNDFACRDFLQVSGIAVPDPDLWNARVAESQAEQAKRQQQQDLAAYLLGSFFAGYTGSAVAAPTQQPSAQATSPSLQAAAPTWSQPQSSMRICPDGSYVYGTECRIAPNGRYLPGPATIAPNGQYVTGRPQIAPNGKYVGGSGPVRICPDGSYVAGSRCMITPNGTYVGAP